MSAILGIERTAKISKIDKDHVFLWFNDFIAYYAIRNEKRNHDGLYTWNIFGGKEWDESFKSLFVGDYNELVRHFKATAKTFSCNI